MELNEERRRNASHNVQIRKWICRKWICFRCLIETELRIVVVDVWSSTCMVLDDVPGVLGSRDVSLCVCLGSALCPLTTIYGAGACRRVLEVDRAVEEADSRRY